MEIGCETITRKGFVNHNLLIWIL